MVDPTGRPAKRARFSRRNLPADTPAKQASRYVSRPVAGELDAYPPPASFVVQGDICDQFQSPLFSKIPPEIRNEIFRLALTEYIPKGNEWTRGSGGIQGPEHGSMQLVGNYVQRPGYEGLKTVDTDLLRTCKRVYNETKLLPLQDTEVCIYMASEDRVPPGYAVSPYLSSMGYVHRRVNWFKPEHWARIHHYHIFGQMYVLGGGFRDLFRRRLDICVPTSMTLTLRYTDWWNWESNERIFPISHGPFFPLRAIQLPSTVRKMTVEFENIEPKIRELEAVIDEMFSRRDYWIWKRRDGRALKVQGTGAEGDGVKTWKWVGPARFGSSRSKFAHHGDGDTMGFVVKVVTWEIIDDAVSETSI